MQAHAAVQVTRHQESRRRDADRALHAVVGDGVDALQCGVAEAESLDQLKGLVTARLDIIVDAVACHQQAESLRQRALQAELDELTQRMQELELEAAQAEQRVAEQRKLVLVDMLTQLPNRHAFDERVRQEWARAQSPDGRLALGVCSIDGLATINASYGELAGDKVLRVVGRTLRARLHRADFVARLSGATFVLLLPDLTGDAALAQIELARTAVAACPFYFRDQPVAVTLSAAVAVASAHEDATTLQVRAQASVRQARAAGGDRSQLAALPATADAT